MNANMSTRGNAPATLSDVIPGPQEPWRMSFDELAIAISLSDAGSERGAHLEQELRRRLRADPKRQARHPSALWFLAGALVAITAFQLGSGIRTTSWRAAAPPSSEAKTFLPAYSLPALRPS